MATTVVIKIKTLRYTINQKGSLKEGVKRPVYTELEKNSPQTKSFYIGNTRAQEEAGSRSGAKGKDSHEFGLPKRFLKLSVVVAECALRTGVQCLWFKRLDDSDSFTGSLSLSLYLSLSPSLSSLFASPIVLLYRSFARDVQLFNVRDEIYESEHSNVYSATQTSGS